MAFHNFRSSYASILCRVQDVVCFLRSRRFLSRTTMSTRKLNLKAVIVVTTHYYSFSRSEAQNPAAPDPRFFSKPCWSFLFGTSISSIPRSGHSENWINDLFMLGLHYSRSRLLLDAQAYRISCFSYMNNRTLRCTTDGSCILV